METFYLLAAAPKGVGPTDLADQYNEPGRFTAIIGYEYTTRGGYNLHRNVLFRGDASVANQTLPFSQFDSQNPEDLWRALDEFQSQTGAEVLAIPHNGNLSNGRMFSVETFDGRPLTPEIGALRAGLEPLVEVTQIKGDGETHPFLSPNDEFADYETWDRSNLNGTELKTDDMLQYEYAREALKTGLKLEQELGVNPFKFGMIGSTDSHTSMATAGEENFFGKHSGVEPDGMLPPVGNTVDVASATWTEEVPMTTQERAYTSPIWYGPGS